MNTVEKKEWKDIKLAVSAALALAGAFSLPFFLNLKDNRLAVSNSYISVFFFGVCWFLLYRSLLRTCLKDRRGLAVAGVFSLFFSVCINFGVQLEREENVDFTDPFSTLSILAWTVILTVLVHRAFEILSCREQSKETGRKKPADTADRKKAALRLSLVFLLIFAAWFVVFLAVYPGFFVYDAQDELTQVITRNFTTHHPLPHVLLLGGAVLFVHKLTGSFNAGIAAYTLLQMLFLSGVFTYTVRWLRRRGAPGYYRVLTVLYFALFPVIVMFALCSAKDGIFSAALLLQVLFTADMEREREAFFSSFRKPFLYAAAAVVMMSFRHNGMYAFLVLSPALIFCMKGCRRKAAAMLGASFAVYFLLAAGLAAAVGARSQEKQELLTVPIQQLARAYYYEKESFSPEELETLYEILPEKALSFYAPKVSDGVKVWFNNDAFRREPGKYIRLWAGIGRKHPFTYLNAWFMTSYGFWYPDTVIDVYRGNSVFTFTYGDSSFFGYEVEEPGTRQSKIPALNEWYRRMSLEITQQKAPVVSMLFSPGFLFWLLAFAICYSFYRKGTGSVVCSLADSGSAGPAGGGALPLLLLALVWLTVILGPTYLPRYVLFLWFALPVLPTVVNRF